MGGVWHCFTHIFHKYFTYTRGPAIQGPWPQKDPSNFPVDEPIHPAIHGMVDFPPDWETWAPKNDQKLVGG
jgi:hypothetical protein